jgi:hypothetical protein
MASLLRAAAGFVGGSFGAAWWCEIQIRRTRGGLGEAHAGKKTGATREFSG